MGPIIVVSFQTLFEEVVTGLVGGSVVGVRRRVAETFFDGAGPASLKGHEPAVPLFASRAPEMDLLSNGGDAQAEPFVSRVTANGAI